MPALLTRLEKTYIHHATGIHDSCVCVRYVWCMCVWECVRVCMRTRLRVCSVHSRMYGHPLLYVAPALGFMFILINANAYQYRCVVVCCGVLQCVTICCSAL